MEAYCYILFSSSLDKHYIGSTELNPNNRLDLHLKESYGKQKFTAKTKDWQLKFSLECVSINQARKIENHIKRMKSSTFIENLILYHELQEKLLKRYR